MPYRALSLVLLGLRLATSYASLIVCTIVHVGVVFKSILIAASGLYATLRHLVSGALAGKGALAFNAIGVMVHVV